MRTALCVLTVALVACSGPVTPERDASSDADASRDADAAFDAVVPMDAATEPDVPTDASRDADAASRVDAAPGTDAARDAGPVPDTGPLLLDGTAPMACADPAVVSATDAGASWFVYCTSMSHVWTTTDWAHFADARGATTFTLAGLSANGQHIGSWWAPGLVYAPDLHQYVMWVSVPDARGVQDPMTGWDTRSLAVLTSDTPTGPWVYRSLGLAATARGQHYIDPFLFRDHDGRRYVYFKRYGGGVSSSIVGAAVDATWQHVVAGSEVVIMDGYGGPGSWEMNVRENPALYYSAATDRYHLLFSGGHWADDSYATGHALSACGPLCVNATNGWRMVSSGDRGVVQVVQSSGDPNFAHGGPGGVVVQDATAQHIVYAAAARGARGDSQRYLMREAIQWRNDAPYVDTAGHRPAGL